MNSASRIRLRSCRDTVWGYRDLLTAFGSPRLVSASQDVWSFAVWTGNTDAVCKVLRYCTLAQRPGTWGEQAPIVFDPTAPAQQHCRSVMRNALTVYVSTKTKTQIISSLYPLSRYEFADREHFYVASSRAAGPQCETRIRPLTKEFSYSLAVRKSES